MAAYYPGNFPADAIAKLLQEIPQHLVEKHSLAVETLKSMCRETLALANQGILKSNLFNHIDKLHGMVELEPGSTSLITVDQEQIPANQLQNFSSTLSGK